MHAMVRPSSSPHAHSSALVRARLVPAGTTEPAWSPWHVWVRGRTVRVHDVAASAVLEADVPGGSDVTALALREVARDVPWWEVALGRPAPVALREILARREERPVVGAVAVDGEQWTVAVNHATDSGPCRLVSGRGPDVVGVTVLDMDVVRCVDGVVAVPGGWVLVDAYFHVARRLTSDGTPVWSFGVDRSPGDADDRLSSPAACTVLGDDVLVVSEMSGRLTVLGLDGALRAVHGGPDAGPGWPRTPTSVSAVGEDHVVVADPHGGSVHLLTRTTDGWRARELATGRTASTRGPLAFPRALLPLGDGFAVADTANGRVVAVEHGAGRITGEVRVGGWPRALATCPGGLLVADGLGSRVLRLTFGDDGLEDADVVEQRVTTADGEPVDLDDPHHLESDGAGGFWLVDSELDDVLHVGPDGCVTARWTTSPAGATRLRDPHQVVQQHDGSLVVLDTNNDRVLVASAGLDAVEVVVDDVRRPRCAVRTSGGWLVAEHSGHIVAFDEGWQRLGAYVLRPEGQAEHVDMGDPPRSMVAHAGRVLVADWQRGVVYDVSPPEGGGGSGKGHRHASVTSRPEY